MGWVESQGRWLPFVAAHKLPATRALLFEGQLERRKLQPYALPVLQVKYSMMLQRHLRTASLRPTGRLLVHSSNDNRLAYCMGAVQLWLQQGRTMALGRKLPAVIAKYLPGPSAVGERDRDVTSVPASLAD